MSVFLCTGGRRGDADEGDEGKNDREHGNVKKLPFNRDSRVSREIGLRC